MIAAARSLSAIVRTVRRTGGDRARVFRDRLAPLLLACVAALAVPSLAQAQTSVARTSHNLSATRPGQTQSGQSLGVCVYCHTPHNASPAPALWNRDSAGVTYQVYASRSMRATVNQPTGTSRLCLSCHDGLLALGNVRTSGRGSFPAPGAVKGPAVIGTDLRDDHPVSFVYDAALAARRGDLAIPINLPNGIRVDGERQLQCSTCHDPHEDRHPNFLRMEPANGALCTTCHRMPQWPASSHATSGAQWNGSGTSPWPKGAPSTVGANACANCHRSHAAQHGEGLLAQGAEPDACNVCHAGTVANKNVAAEFASGAKVSRHPIETAQWTHAPGEDPATMRRHVACADCHEPHAVSSRTAAAGGLPGALQGATGADLSGRRVAPATAEYQLCIKCHDAREPTTAGATRFEATRNVRAKINPGNASYHPIAAPARNASIRGLVGGYTSSSVIGCIDCHNNSDRTPKGAHASRFAPILERNYTATDQTPETPVAYDLCYKCHDRNAIVSDYGGTFPHRIHVVKSQASCAACHDAHGSRLNAHLINFMTRDSSGRAVVTRNSAGRLEYAATVGGKGTCYLKCHGVDHNPLGYGTEAARVGREIAPRTPAGLR